MPYLGHKKHSYNIRRRSPSTSTSNQMFGILCMHTHEPRSPYPSSLSRAKFLKTCTRVATTSAMCTLSRQCITPSLPLWCVNRNIDNVQLVILSRKRKDQREQTVRGGPLCHALGPLSSDVEKSGRVRKEKMREEGYNERLFIGYNQFWIVISTTAL